MKNISIRHLLGAGALVAASLGLGSVALAGANGGIAGTITDAKSGVPVAGATVRISAPSQAITVTTDDRGHYIALSLPPDDYTITAAKQGYEQLVVTNESVEADQTQQYDLQLIPASAPSQ